MLLGGCEEGVVDEEVEQGACALALHLGLDDGDHISFERCYGQFAAFLGEEGAAPYLGHVVLAAIVGFVVLLDLSHVFAEVFAPETFVAWQLVDLKLG